MTQEEKQLLLIDLCARLPYGVQYKDAHGYKKTLNAWSPEFHTALNTILCDGKPSLYLRPMSSMTEEEKKQWLDVINPYDKEGDPIPTSIESYIIDMFMSFHDMSFIVCKIDWLNKYHFDYRGLIEKGLAIEAPEDMYKKIDI